MRNTFRWFKPPSLWHFVVAAHTDEDTISECVFLQIAVLLGLSFPICQSNALGQRDLCDYFHLCDVIFVLASEQRG